MNSRPKILGLLFIFFSLAAAFAQTPAGGYQSPSSGGKGGCITVVANLTSACGGPAGTIASVTDGSTGSDCTVGSGSSKNVCIYSGSAWAFAGSAASNPAFSAVGSGTNANALLVGTGGTLGVTGTGTINANLFNGVSFPTTAVVIGSNGSGQPIAASTTGTGSTAVLSNGPTIIGTTTLTTLHLTNPLATNYGGTGGDSSAANGVAQVSTGTWSYSLTLPGGLTIPSATLSGPSTIVPSGATLTIQSGGTLTCASGSTCPAGGAGGISGATAANELVAQTATTATSSPARVYLSQINGPNNNDYCDKVNSAFLTRPNGAIVVGDLTGNQHCTALTAANMFANCNNGYLQMQDTQLYVDFQNQIPPIIQIGNKCGGIRGIGRADKGGAGSSINACTASGVGHAQCAAPVSRVLTINSMTAGATYTDVNYTVVTGPAPLAGELAQVTAEGVLTITSWTITGTNTFTAQAANSGTSALVVGQQVVINNLTHGSYLNGVTLTVASRSATQFTATFNHANDSATENGFASPVNNNMFRIVATSGSGQAVTNDPNGTNPTATDFNVVCPSCTTTGAVGTVYLGTALVGIFTSGLNSANITRTLTSVNTTGVYQCSNCSSDVVGEWVGYTFTMSGFTNGGNNISGVVTASNTTSITLGNVTTVTETHAGTATLPKGNFSFAERIKDVSINCGEGGGSAIAGLRGCIGLQNVNGEEQSGWDNVVVSGSTFAGWDLHGNFFQNTGPFTGNEVYVGGDTCEEGTIATFIADSTMAPVDKQTFTASSCGVTNSVEPNVGWLIDNYNTSFIATHPEGYWIGYEVGQDIGSQSDVFITNGGQPSAHPGNTAVDISANFCTNSPTTSDITIMGQKQNLGATNIIHDGCRNTTITDSYVGLYSWDVNAGLLNFLTTSTHQPNELDSGLYSKAAQTANLTSNMWFNNANSTNNNTSLGLLAGVSGTSTGGIAALFYDVSGTGDLLDLYSGGSAAAGAYTAGTKEASFSSVGGLALAGALTTNSATNVCGASSPCIGGVEGATGPTPTAGDDFLFMSSTNHCIQDSKNGSALSCLLDALSTVPENNIAGATAAGTITEGGATFSITRAGVATANLTAPWIIQNTNSTNNNTSLGLIVHTPGTSTGQKTLVVSGTTTQGNLIEADTGATVTNGVESGQTAQFQVGPTGMTTLGAATGCSPVGTAGGHCDNEGTAPTGTATVDAIYADSTQHAETVNNNNTGNMPISRVTCVNVTPVTVNANVTTDQNLMTCTLPANLLNVVGRTLHVHAAGIYSTAATSTAALTSEAKLCTVSGCGSGTVIDLIDITTVALASVTVTNNNWNLDFYSTTQTAGASAAFEPHGQFIIDLGSLTTAADSVFADTNTGTIGTIDSTAQLFLQISWAFSAASASNSASQRQGIVEVLN